MKTFVRIALAVTLAISPVFAHADDASRHAKAAELMEAMHGEKMMKQMMDMVTAQTHSLMDQATTGTEMTPEQHKIMDDYMTKVNAITMEYVSWDKLKPMMIDIYASTYTEEELDGITTFFKSPAGQAYLAKAPQMAMAMMGRMMDNMKDMMPRVQALAKEMAEKMKATAPATTENK